MRSFKTSVKLHEVALRAQPSSGVNLGRLLHSSVASRGLEGRRTFRVILLAIVEGMKLFA